MPSRAEGGHGMAYRRMMDVDQVIRRWLAGESIRAAGRSTGLGRNTVRRLIRLGQQAGLKPGDAWPDRRKASEHTRAFGSAGLDFIIRIFRLIMISSTVQKTPLRSGCLKLQIPLAHKPYYFHKSRERGTCGNAKQHPPKQALGKSSNFESLSDRFELTSFLTFELCPDFFEALHGLR
jgi:hypothetical protein